MGKVIIIGIIVLCVVFFVWVALLPNPEKVKAQKEAEQRRREYLTGRRCPLCNSTDIEDYEPEDLTSGTNRPSSDNARYSLACGKRCKRCGNIFWA